MMAGGIGYGKENESQKKKIKEGDYVVVLGGDNYRIGMGGGAVSSVNTGELKNNIELNAVRVIVINSVRRFNVNFKGVYVIFTLSSLSVRGNVSELKF